MVKGKIEDPDYLAMLAQAREKANAVRSQKSAEKKKIKLAKDMEHQAPLAEAEAKLKRLTTASAETAAATPQSKTRVPRAVKPAPPPPPEEEEQDEYTESEGEEEQPPPPPPRSRKSHPQPIPQPRRTPARTQPHAEEDMPAGRPEYTAQQMRLMRAYQSLFDY